MTLDLSAPKPGQPVRLLGGATARFLLDLGNGRALICDERGGRTVARAHVLGPLELTRRPEPAPEPSTCVHHWTVDGLGHATCTKCPAERHFRDWGKPDPEWRVPVRPVARERPAEWIRCACGCGQSILRWRKNSAGHTYERRYIRGHNNRKRESA